MYHVCPTDRLLAYEWVFIKWHRYTPVKRPLNVIVICTLFSRLYFGVGEMPNRTPCNMINLRGNSNNYYYSNYVRRGFKIDKSKPKKKKTKYKYGGNMNTCCVITADVSYVTVSTVRRKRTSRDTEVVFCHMRPPSYSTTVDTTYSLTVTNHRT